MRLCAHRIQSGTIIHTYTIRAFLTLSLVYLKVVSNADYKALLDFMATLLLFLRLFEVLEAFLFNAKQ